MHDAYQESDNTAALNSTAIPAPFENAMLRTAMRELHQTRLYAAQQFHFIGISACLN